MAQTCVLGHQVQQPGKLKKKEIRDSRIGRSPRDDRSQPPHFQRSLVQQGKATQSGRAEVGVHLGCRDPSLEFFLLHNVKVILLTLTFS